MTESVDRKISCSCKTKIIMVIISLVDNNYHIEYHFDKLSEIYSYFTDDLNDIDLPGTRFCPYEVFE